MKGATSDPARGREYAHHPRSGKSQAFHVLLLLDVGWGENWGREGLCRAVPLRVSPLCKPDSTSSPFPGAAQWARESFVEPNG